MSRWISLRTLPTATDSFLDEQFQRPAEQAAGVVDLLDHHLRDIGVGVAGVADRTGQIGGDADLDGVGGRVRPFGTKDPTAGAGRKRGAGKGEIGHKAAAVHLVAIAGH